MVIIADWGNSRVQVFARNNVWVGRYGNGFVFREPDQMALDSAGNVYITEALNYRVLKFNANGNNTRVFGTGIQGSGNTQLNQPSAVAVDLQGNVYVADSGNHRVQKFDSDGGYLQTFGTGYGTAPRQLRGPAGCAVASNGDVFVADFSNDRVQQFTPSGDVVRIFTEAPVSGEPDLKLIGPLALAVDTQDNLFVGDEDLQAVVHFKLNAPAPS